MNPQSDCGPRGSGPPPLQQEGLRITGLDGLATPCRDRAALEDLDLARAGAHRDRERDLVVGIGERLGRLVALRAYVELADTLEVVTCDVHVGVRTGLGLGRRHKVDR